MKMPKSSLSLITLALLSYCGVGYAETEEKVTALEEIKVVADQNETPVSERKVGETTKSAQTLKKQQVQNSRDLVRYETGITVVEKGRFGASGYAMRGVDENRVAITVDGLQQAEALSSEGFKDLFEGYGNFNNNRNGVEVETLKQVKIHKGANSIKSGSGALGGSVVFETKDARDFLIDKNWYAAYKKGYNSADGQHVDTLTLAGRYQYFDALLVHTKRKGHEIENFDYKKFDAKVQGRTREKADPYKTHLDSTLVKFAFQPNDNHRFTVMADLYETQSKGADFSYTLNSTRLTDFGDSRKELEYRHNHDRVKRTNYAFSYENYSSNPLWDTLKLTYSEQKIRLRARNEDYCDGNDECSKVQNPLGLKYNEKNELVDSNGEKVVYANSEGKIVPRYDEVGQQVTDKDWANVYKGNHPDPEERRKARARTYNQQRAFDSMKRRLEDEGFFDKLYEDYKNKGITLSGIPTCASVQDDFDADGNNLGTFTNLVPSGVCKIRVDQTVGKFRTLTANGATHDLLSENSTALLFDLNKRANANHTFKCNQEGGINCDVPSMKGAHLQTGEIVDIPLEVFEQNGEKFARTQELKDGRHVAIFRPSSAGYNSNLWTDRSLTTQTKQINLDLTKYLELGKTEHNLSYGAALSKVKKEMFNQSGDSSNNTKWWALYPEDCTLSSSSLCNKSNTFSFLIPVRATNKSLYFADDFKVNDYLSFELGYRYDRISYKPEYVAGVTPKIPDDMVDGLAKNFVDPYKAKAFLPEPTVSEEPKFWDFGYGKVAEYKAAKARYDQEKAEYERVVAANKVIAEENKEIANQNKLARHQANVNAIARKTSFSAHSYALGVNIDPTDYLRLQFKYAKGFRAPTSDEVYFTFKHPDFTIIPNLDLEQETAKTSQAALTLYKDFGFITLSYFETKYKNFIDLAYKGERFIKTGSAGGSISYPVHQNTNRESAKVSGIEIDSRLNLGVIHKKLEEFALSYKMTYQKGKVKVKEALDDAGNETIDVMAPINAIQPLTNVFGLSYNHNSGKFGFDLYVTHTKAKKAKDTYNDLWRVRKRNEETIDPQNIGGKNVTKDSTTRWRSGSYTLVDLVAYAKPTKNITLQFGVYNLTNRKYMTWDSARSIKQFGTSNRIDYVTGAGINRFYAPGRNFKLSAEIAF